MRAELGQYVMPNPCLPEVEKDSGGFAGCITRIERRDCTVELLREGKKVVEKLGESEVDGDKKETIYVTWALDGLEKGEMNVAAHDGVMLLLMMVYARIFEIVLSLP